MGVESLLLHVYTHCYTLMNTILVFLSSLTTTCPIDVARDRLLSASHKKVVRGLFSLRLRRQAPIPPCCAPGPCARVVLLMVNIWAPNNTSVIVRPFVCAHPCRDESIFDMGSSPSAASERWRRAACTSGPRCVLVGSIESYDVHCDVGVDSSPPWRSCC